MDKNEIEKGLLQNIGLGMVKEISPGQFSITEMGKAYVESMPFESDLESHAWIKGYQACQKQLN